MKAYIDALCIDDSFLLGNAFLEPRLLASLVDKLASPDSGSVQGLLQDLPPLGARH